MARQVDIAYRSFKEKYTTKSVFTRPPKREMIKAAADYANLFEGKKITRYTDYIN